MLTAVSKRPSTRLFRRHVLGKEPEGWPHLPRTFGLCRRRSAGPSYRARVHEARRGGPPAASLRASIPPRSHHPPDRSRRGAPAGSSAVSLGAFPPPPPPPPP